MQFVETYSMDEWALELLSISRIHATTSHDSTGTETISYRPDSRVFNHSRLYGPAYFDTNDVISHWMIDNRSHRVGLPAFITKDRGPEGYIFFFYEEGKLSNKYYPSRVDINYDGKCTNITYQGMSSISCISGIINSGKLSEHYILDKCVTELKSNGKFDSTNHKQVTKLFSMTKAECEIVAPYWYASRFGLYDIDGGLVPESMQKGWLGK